MTILFPLGNAKPRNQPVIGFDIETYGRKNNFVCCSFNTKEENFVFKRRQDAIDFLQSRKCRGAILVATNLMFDFFGLFQGMKEKEYFNLVMRDGRLLSCWSFIDDKSQLSHKKKRNKLRFVDTMNYLPASVEQLGSIVKEPKLKTPGFLGERPETPEQWEELLTYNERDARISRLFFEFLDKGFQERNCKLRMTIAATSMDYWRRNYQEETLFQPKKELLLEHFKGYYGGRTEVFKRGKIDQDLNYYDFNSLYPSVMRNKFPHPNSLSSTKKGSIRIIEEFEGMSNVIVASPKIYQPILPYRDEKVIFPAGQFRGWHSHIELRKAMDNGYSILDVQECFYYTETFSPFKKYVGELYKQRMKYKEDGNKMQLLYKLLLNSLYGKYGQRIEGQQDVIHESKVTHDMLMKQHERMDDYFIFKSDSDYIPPYVHPIIAIYTTSYARLKLWDAMKKCDAYYVDTDSISTPDRLKTGKGLGELKKEFTIKEGWFVKPKLYYFKGEDDKGEKIEVFKAKGVMRTVKSRSKSAVFNDILNGKKIDYERFVKLRQALRSKEAWKYGKLGVNEIIKTEKLLTLEDDKRVWEKPFCKKELQFSRPITL